MKKNNILLLIYILILSSIFLSCSRGVDNTSSPYYYYLKIRFEDKSGNDIVHGIDTGDNKPENSIYEISKNAYKLNVIQTGKEEEKLILVPLYLQITDSYNCLIIITGTLPSRDYRPSQLTHKLICPHIFGDEEEHMIISNWEETGPVSNACTSVIMDGKTYSTIETDKEGYSILLVVLDE